MLDPDPLTVRCSGCAETSLVSSRSAFSEFEEHHAKTCEPSWLTIDQGTLDDVLDLPPY